MYRTEIIAQSHMKQNEIPFRQNQNKYKTVAFKEISLSSINPIPYLLFYNMGEKLKGN